MLPLLIPAGLALIGGYLTKDSGHQIFAKGGKIDDSDIHIGSRFGMRNGEVFEIIDRYIEPKYIGDDRVVVYTRSSDNLQYKNTVDTMRKFFNNWKAVLISSHLEETLGEKYWTKYDTGGSIINNKKGGKIAKLCPVGTEIQTLIFDKELFSKSEAKNWANKAEFIYGFVDEKENTYRIRQKEMSEFEKDSFRTITITDGVKAVIGCPKKKK